ncbi:MAG: hypothetical protein ACI970_001781 [Myxococcota bacterium]|jgi:hypothetical protein
MPATTGPSLTVTEACCGGWSTAWWLVAGVALTQVSPSLTQRRLSSTIGERFILQLRATDHRQRSESSRMTVELRWLLAAGCWLLAAGCWLLAAGVLHNV